MLLLNENIEKPGLKSAAESICVADRTAPKGKGVDSELYLHLVITFYLSDTPELRVLHRR